MTQDIDLNTMTKDTDNDTRRIYGQSCDNKKDILIRALGEAAETEMTKTVRTRTKTEWTFPTVFVFPITLYHETEQDS